MKTKIFCVLLVALLAITCVCQASTRADVMFISATTSLSSSKTATFSAKLNNEAVRISVTKCELWKYEENGDWSYQYDLPTPTYVAQNTVSYATFCSYAANIGSGTYMIKTTFNADGYEITRNSNERTF